MSQSPKNEVLLIVLVLYRIITPVPFTAQRIAFTVTVAILKDEFTLGRTLFAACPPVWRDIFLWKKFCAIFRRPKVAQEGGLHQCDVVVEVDKFATR